MSFDHQEIELFIINNISLLSSISLDNTEKSILDNDIFNSGYVDSFGILSLIAILEDEYAISIDNEYLDSDKIRTISGLASIVYRIKMANNE